MKNKRGITLVALIITIIVLLILAGVVISMTVGNDGIIGKAQGAVDAYKNAQEKEETMLNQTLEYMNGEYKLNIKDNGQENSGLNTSNFDESLIDDRSTLLYLAGVKNISEYNNTDIINNETIMNNILNSSQAFDYMLKSKFFILPAVCKSETALGCIMGNEQARKKAMQNTNFKSNIKEIDERYNLTSIATKIPNPGVTENMISSGTYSDENGSSNLNAAFDGILTSSNRTQCWIPYSKTDDTYIGYTFGKATNLYKFTLTATGYATLAYSLEGLKQDGTWERIGNEGYIMSSSYESKTYYITTDKNYYGYRIRNNYTEAVETNSTVSRYWHEAYNYAVAIIELQFYCIDV